MKIGILYIATGRYICFWDEFYKSAQDYLFKGHDVHYFVFTDSAEINFEDKNNVTKVFAQSSKWPISVCDKYAIILSAKKLYADFDYVFYFNGNMKFLAPVGEEILPQKEHGYLAICEWANYKDKTDPDTFPYERNSSSCAYIPFGSGKHYFMGGLHGGRVKEYVNMCEELDSNTRKDFANGIIALWHDESHINRYFLNRTPLLITPDYAMPENWKIKGYKKNIKASVLKKNHWKYGGLAYLRGLTDKKITPVKYWINKLFNLKLQ